MGKIAVLFFLIVALNPARAAAQLNPRPAGDSAAGPVHLQVLPQNFYSRQLGYFCKKEVQVQKATTLPLYFRLGSKAYVDYLERKPNAVKQF